GRWVAPSRRTLSIMVDEPFDPRATVLLEGDGRPEEVAARLSPPTAPAVAGRMAAAEVRVERYEPAHVSIAAKTSMAGFLVLTDAYYPGWRALVNGEERRILLANYLYRAVPLEAGDHRVEFVYEPVSLRWGLAVTALALLVVGLVVVGALVQGKRQKEKGKRPGDHRRQA
ncbi:MAG: YfhO family protein, partial [Chloroflexi bacterium]|nr:YfhO family protein [Chloroflexota bacterium]